MPKANLGILVSWTGESLKKIISSDAVTDGINFKTITSP